MTRVGSTALALAIAAVFASRCVCGLDSNGVGDGCQASKDCLLDLVCVHLDEGDLDSPTICMPGVSFDKTPCSSDEECLSNGMPVDVFCGDDGLCTCEGLIADGAPSCYTGNAHGRFACACVALDEGEAGDQCDHPESCASVICNDGQCANACDSNDDCGGPTTTCEGDGTCS